jgi:hypothetical protein
MGNCCLKKPKYRIGTINKTLKYKTKDEWYKATQKKFIEILSRLNNKKKQFKLMEKRRLGMTKTIDDMSKGKSTNFEKNKYKLQSEHIKKLKSNNEFLQEAIALRKNTLQNNNNIWENIKIEDIQKPTNLDIRNSEYKHIIRKNFDLIHWDILLRIIQVNSHLDHTKNFTLMKNQIELDYRVKYDSIFKKSKYKGKLIVKIIFRYPIEETGIE